MTQAERIDKVFTWLASSKNENPSNERSRFLTKAGYTGPIMEIFATPVLVVAPTHAPDKREQENMQACVESLKAAYKKYFHGAECKIKTDDAVTQDDIKNNSLILIGNPQSNSVWLKLQQHIPVTMTGEKVLYKEDTLAGNEAFEIIVRHPSSADKYILLIGAKNWSQPRPDTAASLFTAWYDGLVLSTPRKIISKLDSLRDTQIRDTNSMNYH
jgi:hypothetical protein